jgi:hypothetical protein
MRKLAISCSVLGATLALALSATTPAQAQATRTWVSGVGDDANPCSRTAPCKTFAGTISKTAASGIINCLDPGGFGAVTITKSMTIDCAHTAAGVLSPGGNGVVINALATDIVRLSGLDVEGVGTGLIGVNSIQVDALHIERCNLLGFRAAPTSGVNTERDIANSADNNSNNGVVIDLGTPSVKAVLSDLAIANNTNGIQVDGNRNTSGIRFSLGNADQRRSRSETFALQQL